MLYLSTSRSRRSGLPKLGSTSPGQYATSGSIACIYNGCRHRCSMRVLVGVIKRQLGTTPGTHEETRRRRETGLRAQL